jgi:hygromycin-B 7''-O-kinase
MAKAFTYSQRLGAISDEQFAAATARLDVGKFLRATPITSGLFGQNVFLGTTRGEFVLRGAPHYVSDPTSGGAYVRNDLWQFRKEAFFARLLHERTQAPAPWPMLLDEASDIFGWPYLIMPRMPGECFSDRSIREIPRAAQLRAARALARGLSEQQKLEWTFAGDFDFSMTLAPYPRGHAAHLVTETSTFTDRARANGSIRTEDDAWLAEIFDPAQAGPPSGRPSVYVHGDFKFNNLTLSGGAADWRVTGIFDLHESRFGDGASDLCRQVCSYLDFGDEECARAFLSEYHSGVADDTTIKDRMPLYIVSDRMKFWEYFTRPDVDADWLKGKTFKGWTGSYVERILKLL